MKGQRSGMFHCRSLQLGLDSLVVPLLYVTSQFPQLLSFLRSCSQSQKIPLSASSKRSFRTFLTLLTWSQFLTGSTWLRGLQSCSSSRLPLDRLLISSLSVSWAQHPATFSLHMLPGCQLPMELSAQQTRHASRLPTIGRIQVSMWWWWCQWGTLAACQGLLSLACYFLGAKIDVLSCMGQFCTDYPAVTNWTSCFWWHWGFSFAKTLMFSVSSKYSVVPKSIRKLFLCFQNHTDLHIFSMHVSYFQGFKFLSCLSVFALSMTHYPSTYLVNTKQIDRGGSGQTSQRIFCVCICQKAHKHQLELTIPVGTQLSNGWELLHFYLECFLGLESSPLLYRQVILQATWQLFLFCYFNCVQITVTFICSVGC